MAKRASFYAEATPPSDWFINKHCKTISRDCLQPTDQVIAAPSPTVLASISG